MILQRNQNNLALIKVDRLVGTNDWLRVSKKIIITHNQTRSIIMFLLWIINV